MKECGVGTNIEMGVFEIIDINSHILLDFQDSARTFARSMDIAREALKQGIHTIIATPYYTMENDSSTGGNIENASNNLTEMLQEEQIPVQILPGQITRVHGEILEELRNGHMIPLNKNSCYVLLELPYNIIPYYTTQLLFDMQIAGYRPIIANAEKLLTDPDKLYRMIKNGALTQLTAGSIIGKNGKRIQRFAIQMLESNLVHFVASNYVKRQRIYMHEAFQFIRKQYGNIMANRLIENSKSLVTGSIVLADPPERIRDRSMRSLVGGLK